MESHLVRIHLRNPKLKINFYINLGTVGKTIDRDRALHIYLREPYLSVDTLHVIFGTVFCLDSFYF